MKTIGACFVKIGGSVRLALIQDNNGVKSVVPVGGAFAPFACAAGTANNMDMAGTLTPALSQDGRGSQSAPTFGEGSRVGMVVNQTPGNLFEIGGLR